MKALLLDAGNTRIKVKAWPDQGWVSPSRAEMNGVTPSLDILAEFNTKEVLDDSLGLCRELVSLREKEGIPAVVLVSVIPAISGILSELWPDLVVPDHNSILPFTSLVKDLSAVGPDRLCNVAAACAENMTDALIVDAGTATTFDVLADGVFLGGLIAPGMAFAARQLGDFGARLNPVPFGPCPLELGLDTQSAMAGGAWHVGIGGVEAVIDGLTRDKPGLQVVLTGGLGHHFSASDRILDPDWTLRGAAQLAGLRDD